MKKYLGEFQHINEKEYIWYKLLCYYYAKTELFDRGLTDLRSPYDITEAYIDEPTGTVRHLSNNYALKIRKFIVDAAIKLNIPKDIINFNRFQVYHYSAQGWIDEYYRLKENGEMDFLNNLGG